MIEFFKAVRYKYWWEALLSHINIHEPKGLNPHLTVFRGKEFSLYITLKSGMVSKIFPMTTQGFRSAIDWMNLNEKISSL